MRRSELLGALDDITPVEESVIDAFKCEAQKEWRSGDVSPHGMPWHTSFHGSSFPGDDPLVCGRAQVYGLLNPAKKAPVEPWLQCWFDIGSDIEHRFVSRLDNYGILLSNNVVGGDEIQTGFTDTGTWLTGSTDAIILPRWQRKAHMIEIKTTSDEKVKAMLADRNNTVSSHEKYLRQIKCYIGMAHEMPYSPLVTICRVSGTLMDGIRCKHCVSGECDPVLIRVEPPDEGTLIYLSREEPIGKEGQRAFVSYYVQYDPDFTAAGRERVKSWKDYFLKDEIPPHIHEGQRAKWSVKPCDYCDCKPFCKEDFKEKRTVLSESALIEFTRSIRPHYDPDKTRQMVLDRWEK